MIDDSDIFRVAKLMIDQDGDKAATYAAGRMLLLIEDGDLTARWCGAGS